MPDNTAVQYGQGWGQNVQDLSLPSGAICQMRKLQMEDLVEMGIMDQIDFLGLIVEEKTVGKTKKPSDRPAKRLTKAEQDALEEQQSRELLKDPKKFGAMNTMIEKIVVQCVVTPSLSLAYVEQVNEDGTKVSVKLPLENRVAGRIYSDTVPLEDKMKIFEVAFEGVQAMSDFRPGSSEGVGDLDGESGDEVPTE